MERKPTAGIFTHSNKKPFRLGRWPGIVVLIFAGLFSLASVSESDAPTSVQLKLLRTINAPYAINHLAWHPDNKELAVGQSLNKKIIIWDVATGKAIHTIESEAGGVGALTYSPDGTFLAVGRIATRLTRDHAHVHVYDANSANLIRRLTPPDAVKGDANDVRALAFNPNSRYLATHGYGGGAVGVVYDLSNMGVLATLDPSTSIYDAVASLAWSPDGRSIALGRALGRLEVWNAFTWKLETQRDVSRQRISALTFSHDSRVLAFGGFKITAEQAEAAKKELSFAPESFRLTRPEPAAVSHDIFLLDRGSLIILNALSSSHNGGSIKELIFTPAGNFLISGAGTKSIAVHRVGDWEEAVFLKEFKQPAHPALSRDGKYLAVGTGREIRVYELIY